MSRSCIDQTICFVITLNEIIINSLTVIDEFLRALKNEHKRLMSFCHLHFFDQFYLYLHCISLSLGIKTFQLNALAHFASQKFNNFVVSSALLDVSAVVYTFFYTQQSLILPFY